MKEEFKEKELLSLCSCGAHTDIEIINDLWIIECFNCQNKVSDNSRIQCIQKWEDLIKKEINEIKDSWPSDEWDGKELDI